MSGLLLLEMLEKTRSRYNLPSSLPVNKKAFTDADKSVPWITPSTMDSFKTPSTLESLKVSDQLVGVRGGVVQRISVKKRENITGISCLHDEWTAFYDTDVYIFKQKLL